MADRLAAAGVANPLVDAGWLVEAATTTRRVDLARLEEMVTRRIRRVPLQVVVGTTAFRTITLAVQSGVFIPRPETEVVAGVAIEAALAISGRAPLVVDACTGSGPIALAVAAEVPRVRVIATELDTDARALAASNLTALAVRTPASTTPWAPGDHLAPHASVDLVAGHLLEEVDPSLVGRVDVLVSNPPYLPGSDRDTWAPEVADHDPERALVAGPDGHELVAELLGDAGRWLRPGGVVVIEIDDRRGPEVLDVARAGGLAPTRLVQDLTGRDRAVCARRPDHT